MITPRKRSMLSSATKRTGAIAAAAARRAGRAVAAKNARAMSSGMEEYGSQCFVGAVADKACCAAPPPQKTPTSPRAPRGTRRAARAARAVRVQPRNAQGLSDGIARAPRSTVPQEARRVRGASRGPDLGVDQGRQGYAPPRVATAAPLVPALPRVPCCATRV